MTQMKHYPRTAKYDQNWIAENWMGPHPLWLLEELCENLDLQWFSSVDVEEDASGVCG